MNKWITYILFFALLLAAPDAIGQKKKKKSKKSKTEQSEEDDAIFKFIFHDAIREKMIGNYMASITLFKKASAMKPKEAAVHYALSDLYAQIGDFVNAFEHGKESVSINPNNKYYKLNFAQISFQASKYKEAAHMYEDLLKQEPGNLEYLYQYSECLLYMEELEDVMKVYDKIEEITGVYMELSRRKHEIYRNLKKPDKAVAELQKLIDSSPGNSEYYQYLIDYYNSIGAKEKAFETLEIMIEKNPNDGYAQIALSEHYMNQNELEKAMEAIKMAFSGTSVDIDTKVKLLITLYDISENNMDLTMTGYSLLDSLEKHHPNEAKSYSIKGDFFLRDGRNSDARKAFKKASELDDTRFAIWQQLVLLDDELQNYEYMWEDAYLAGENFPSQPMFYLYQGMAGLKLRKYEESADMLEFGRDLVVNNPKMKREFDLLLAEAWFKTKNYKKSFELYEELIKGDSENSLLLNNYAYYLSLANMNLTRARELSLKANKLKPNVSTYQDTYAYVLFREGKYQDALKWAEKAKNSASYESGTILEHLGDIYFMLEDVEKAIQYWQKALKFNDHSNVLELKIKDKKFYEAK